uniref:HTH_Tnp_Tc3_1 domain-containing protein n=1 Tax=Heterorhabditis bacteriophora TaxID=37862 RepID=A0A1I7XHJ5_HETBA
MFKISLNYLVSEVPYNIQSSSHNYCPSYEQGEKIVIAKKLCATKMAVRRTVKRYQGLGIVKDRPRSGRPIWLLTSISVQHQ